MKTRAVKYIRIILGILLLFIILNSIEFGLLKQRISSLNITLFFVLILTSVADRILMAFKWKLLLEARSISITLLQSIRLYYVAHLFGTFTPGGLGGDAYRILALSSHNKNKEVASTVVVERAIGMVTTLMCALIALPFSFHYLGASAGKISLFIFFATIMFLYSLYLSFSPSKIKKVAQKFPRLTEISAVKKIKEFYYVYAEYRFYKGVLFWFFILTTIELFVAILVNYLAAISLAIMVDFFYFLYVLPLLFLLIRIPITFQGLGVQEGLLAYFVLLVGFSAADGVSISLILRIGGVLAIMIPAMIILWITPLATTSHTRKTD